jgi:hypothetical protein
VTGKQDCEPLAQVAPRRLQIPVAAQRSDSRDLSFCHLSAKEASQVAQVGRD